MKTEAAERNKENVTRLAKKIEALQGELRDAKGQHNQEETLLTGKYIQEDKAYTEALEQYDTEMRDHNKQKDIVTKEFEDSAEQLRQVKEQWAER